MIKSWVIYFTTHTINCVCRSIRSMFRVLEIYNFEYTQNLENFWKLSCTCKTSISWKCKCKCTKRIVMLLQRGFGPIVPNKVVLCWLDFGHIMWPHGLDKHISLYPSFLHFLQKVQKRTLLLSLFLLEIHKDITFAKINQLI